MTRISGGRKTRAKTRRVDANGATGDAPAGSPAAYRLITRTGIVPLCLEKSESMGGISRTVNYKGNRIDIGGHLFFSKSDRVMDWWRNVMPVQSLNGHGATISDQRQTTTIAPDLAGPNPESEDLVMLVRERNAGIDFRRRCFTYAIAGSAGTWLR